MNIPEDMLKKKKQEEALNSETQQDVVENLPQDGSEQQTAQSAEAETGKLEAEVDELNNKYLRLYAEFDNFKRRTSKERTELFQTAGKDILVSLLPVLDDFERALKSMETASDVDAVKEGVDLIHSKLKNVLSQKGLKEMESVGKEFDADLHDAITNIPAPTEDMKGKVIDELEKGYYLNDKVIRFAKVVVGA